MEKRHIFNKYSINKLWRLRFGKAFVLCVVVLIVVFTFIIGLSRISGASMYPTLEDGQLVIYFRLDQNYEQGDIISVKMTSGEHYIKRVAAVAGDIVEIEDGKLYVNGKESEIPSYGETEKPDVNGIRYPLVLKDGQLFVIGDNREKSIDSRTFGPVSLSQVMGKILFVQ